MLKFGSGGGSGDPDDFRATLAEHIDEFRTRLIRAALWFVAGSIIGWFLFPLALHNLSGVVFSALKGHVDKVNLTYMSMMAPFMLRFKMSLYIGLLLSLPFIVWEVWGFVSPGLRPSEKEPLRKVVPISLVLFVLGVAVGYVSLIPTFSWFIGFQSDTPEFHILQDPEPLVMFCLKMMLAFGVSFQMPLIVYFLAGVGIISPDYLWRYWRQSVVAVFTVAMIVTPSADPFSMLALAIPLSLLFFGSVLAAKISFSKGSSRGELDNLD